MADFKVGNISIGLNLFLGNFSKRIKSSIGDIKGLASSLHPLAAGLNVLQGALRAVTDIFGEMAAPFTSISGAARKIREEFAKLDILGETAEKLGMTAEALRGFQMAADFAGISNEQLVKSLQRLERVTGDAVAGNEKARASFESIGIDPDTFTSAEDAFAQTVEGLRNIEDRALRTSKAYEIFGRQGNDLGIILDGGAESLDEFRKKADKLGGSLENIGNIAAAQDALDEMQYAIDGIFQQVAIALAPVVKALADMFLELGVNGSSASDYIITGMKWVGSAIAFVADMLDVVWMGFKGGQWLVTKVIGVILQQIAYLAKALQWVINWLPGVEVQFGDTIQAMADGVHKAADDIGKELSDSFNAPSSGEKINRFFQKLEADAKNGANGVDANTRALERMNKKLAEVNQEAFKFVDNLYEQIDTFGMSGDEAKIWALKQKGASKSTLEAAEKLIVKLNELKAAADLRKEADKIAEGLITPLQKYQKEIAKIEELRKKNLLTDEQAAAQGQKLWETLTSGALAAQSPLQEYYDKVANLRELLQAGVINEEQAIMAAHESLPSHIKDLLEPQRTAIDEYKSTISDLNTLLQSNAISAEEYALAIGNALPDTVKQLYEDTKTPAEKIGEQLNELKQMAAAGLIDPETLKRATEQIASQMPAIPLPFADVAEAGSREAREAILRHRFDSVNDPQERIAKLQEEATKAQKRQVPLLEELIKKTGQRNVINLAPA